MLRLSLLILVLLGLVLPTEGIAATQAASSQAQPHTTAAKTKTVKTKNTKPKVSAAKPIKKVKKKAVQRPQQYSQKKNSAQKTHLVHKTKVKHGTQYAKASQVKTKFPHHAQRHAVHGQMAVDDDDDDDDDDIVINSSTRPMLVQNTNNFAQNTALNAKNQQLVDYATRFLGTGYRFGGISPMTGFDCSGYVSYVYSHAAGIELPHNASAISRVGAKVPRADLRPGDLVFFGHRFRRAISHVGIYMGNNQFIHASSSRSGYVQISDLRERYWMRNFEGARRLMGGAQNFSD